MRTSGKMRLRIVHQGKSLISKAFTSVTQQQHSGHKGNFFSN